MTTGRREELFRALQSKGYPDDFCKELAYRQLNTDYTATRMLGYLYRYSEPRIEDAVDEMLAILSDRNSLTQKHEAEQAQAAISEIYRNGLGVPAEFNTREELEENPIIDMTGYGTYDQPPGTWSDDSSMALATLDSLTDG